MIRQNKFLSDDKHSNLAGIEPKLLL